MEPSSVYSYSLEYQNYDHDRVERVRDAIRELLEDEPDFEEGNILLDYTPGYAVVVALWPEVCSHVPEELHDWEEFKYFCEINEE